MSDVDARRQQLRRVLAVVLAIGALVTLGSAALLALAAYDRSVWEAAGVAVVPSVVGLVSLYAARRIWRA